MSKKLAFVVLALLMCITPVCAQEPEYDYFVYLPVVLRSPVAAPAPTQTPTLQPTGTPSPTPSPSGLHVLPNSSHFTSYGYLRIVGEVQNNTSNHLRFVSVTANVFNSGGQLLDTDYTYIQLGSLPSGEKTCFGLWIEEPANWSYYEFEPPNYWEGGELPPNLVLLNDSGLHDPVYDDYQIVGQMRNDHGSEVKYARTIGTLYNASGIVIDCDYTYVNSTHLSPGQTSSFKIWYYGRGYSDVSSYRLQADGAPQ